ncbi:MAG: glycosyltransferase family 39 protein, partial [Pirellulales bacterium]
MSITSRSGLTVAIVAALVLLPNLGGPPLWDDDEPRNAACSLAMHRTGDWVVPTFNGRLRVEKPVLVNWLHLAGFAVAGVNETGVRLASALLTIGTCLLTLRISQALFRPEVGLWAGLAMATCLWTGVSGRAATPDAPLVFCTTLALWLFVRGARIPTADGTGWRNGAVYLPVGAAVGVGVACGLAVLAKGPVGLMLPLVGLGGFCWWQAAVDPGREGGRLAQLATAFAAACRGLRLHVVMATAAAVSLPWYVLVTIRTGGVWLHDFLLVHNVGRFATPMEGHSGSAILYYPAIVLIGMFPWSMASALIAAHARRTVRSGADTSDTVGMRLALCWIAAWVVPFSLAGTKLPGYVWPAYPAIAAAVGLFVADWIRQPAGATDGWMRWAWSFLAASGIAIGIGVPIVTHSIAPGAEWLGLVGLVPVFGA